VQPFGNLRRRICRPQGDKFAEFLVGPAGHGRPQSSQPQRLVPCPPIRGAVLAIASFPQAAVGSNRFAIKRAPDAVCNAPEQLAASIFTTAFTPN
jgi:hypothetical protein